MNLYLWSGATGVQPSLWSLKDVVGKAGEQEDQVCGGLTCARTNHTSPVKASDQR